MAFKKRGEALAWASRQEQEILSSHLGIIPDKTVGDIIDRYLAEEVPHKKGAKAEAIRCKALRASRLAAVRCKYLEASHLAAWQQERLKSGLKGASVRRERNLLNHALNLAVREWGWLKFNPFPSVRKPADSKPRDRVPTVEELDALMARASPEMQRVITVAVNTGLRAKEIAELREVKGRIAYVKDSKTKAGVRMIPLTTEAVRVLGEGPVAITPGSISSMFARLCDELKIKDLHFHDLRRYAGSWLSKHMDPMQLARMMGHSDPRVTLKVYYHDDVAALAEKLG